MTSTIIQRFNKMSMEEIHMRKKTWMFFDFSIAAVDCVCGVCNLRDGRVGSAVLMFALAGALTACGIYTGKRRA